MEADKTLGILVNSNQYFDFVLMLTEAATAKGKHVKIHLQGPGLDLIDSDSFEHLLNIARISMRRRLAVFCRDSSKQFSEIVERRNTEKA